MVFLAKLWGSVFGGEWCDRRHYGRVHSVQTPTLLLFTVFAFGAIENAGVLNIFLALLGQLSVLTLCSWQIKRQLKKAGVSNSIGLFALPKA